MQLAVACGCGVAAFYALDTTYFRDAAAYPKTAITSSWLPVLVVVALAYVIADKFMQVGWGG